MAHLWIRRDDVPGGGQPGQPPWALLPLTGEEINLTPDDEADTGVLLVREPRSGRSGWVVIAGATRRIAVNGTPLRAGFRVLADRDEIRIDGAGSMFLSTESPAHVEDCPDDDRGKLCPRCKLELAPASPTVRCPDCDLRYHQSEDYPCWTYAESCALCPRSTDLDGALRWTPEALE